LILTADDWPFAGPTTLHLLPGSPGINSRVALAYFVKDEPFCFAWLLLLGFSLANKLFDHELVLSEYYIAVLSDEKGSPYECEGL
jgi:hypothetical protein